ncbi:MAG: tetrapyrrole methylase family protein / MazG family protein [Thermomicrobiales bacterium]|nr:tetrapyrrole methylase family protein / MazG family protein [Thermomicrobiales bacterium]
MPGSLTIVGLGPGDPGLRTVDAQRALDRAERIILRTAIHPGIDDLVADRRTTTCDDLYDQESSFEDVYQGVVDRVRTAAESAHVVYAVPGHPLFGERTVALLLERSGDATIPTTVCAAVSAFDAVSVALSVDSMAEEVQILDATTLDAWLRREPFGGGLLDIAPSRPILVTQVYSREVASSVKLALSRIYADDHQIRVVIAAGVGGEESVVSCPLHELDRLPVNHLTSVWVPALPLLQATRSAATLHHIAAILRSPEGCPWDRKQSHQSLRTAAIEEAHEVVDAIDEGDSDHLAEELGDLLLQVALHAQIAEEAGEFTIEDVYDHINRKLVRRHPHVFADVDAATAEDVVQTWQGIKAEERRSNGKPDPASHPFDRLPRSMPALTRVAHLLESSAMQAPAQATDDLGDRLLDAVEVLVRAGLDPERELELAFRRRTVALV